MLRVSLVHSHTTLAFLHSYTIHNNNSEYHQHHHHHRHYTTLHYTTTTTTPHHTTTPTTTITTTGKSYEWRLAEVTSKKHALLSKWSSRLAYAPGDVSVYRQVLAVHSLVATTGEDLGSWLRLVKLCR